MAQENSGEIKLLEFDYTADHLKTPEQQGDFLFDVLLKETILHDRIAILYSANNVQSEKLYQFYRSESKKENFDKIIEGSNQAKAFKVLSEKIVKKALLDKMHILPVTTLIKGGSDELPEIKHIIRDLSKIQAYLEKGWCIYILTNTTKLQRNENKKYQIGGGKSQDFYNVLKKRIPFQELLLSYGHFVEKFIDELFKIYGDLKTPTQEKIMSKKLLKKILNPYQTMLLTNDDDIQYELNIDRPVPLRGMVISAFTKNNLIPQNENPVQQIAFSPSWNFRIQFLGIDSNQVVIKNILSALSDYDAKQLSSLMENPDQIAQYTISIASKNVFSFLKNYCSLETEEIAFFVAKTIEKNPQSGFNFFVKKMVDDSLKIAITPFYILFNEEVFTLEEAKQNKKFGVTHKNPFELFFQTERHPQAVAELVSSIMDDLKREKKSLLKASLF
jgi:hypothetical protein